MKFIFLILQLMAVVPCGLACSINVKFKQNTEDTYNGRYSLPNLKTSDGCTFTTESHQPTKDIASYPKGCKNLLPAVKDFMRGVVLYKDTLFAVDGSIEPNCESLKPVAENRNAYKIPKNLNVLEEYKDITEIVEVTRDDIINLLGSPNVPDSCTPQVLNIQSTERVMIYSNIIHATKAPRIRIYRLITQISTVTTERPVLTKGLQFAYRNLPANSLEATMKFILRYGSHLKLNATYGGVVEYVTTDFVDMGTDVIKVLDTALSSRYPHASKLVMFGGNEAVTISEWKKSLFENPYPIKMGLKPISNVLQDTSKDSKQLKMLIKAEEYIINNSIIRRIHAGLNLFIDEMNKDDVKPHVDLIRNVLRSELQNICPSQALMSLIVEGLIKPQNLRLSRYGLMCTSKLWYNRNITRWLVTTRDIQLIPGICFMKSTEVGECQNEHVNYPPGTNCIKFYDEVDCKGQGVTVVEGNKKFGKALMNTTSLSFC